MYDLCYIVSHGFVSRMLTQTDLLAKLRKKNTLCILMTKNDQQLEQYCDKNKIDYLILPDSGKSFFEYYNKRRYFLEDIEKNPALYEKHIHATSIKPSRNPFKLLKIYYYFLCYKLIKIFPFIRKNFQKNEKKLLKNDEYQKLLKKINPKLLISTYPVDISEATLLHYANLDKQIKTCIQFLSWDNISCKGRFIELADKYIVWGKIMKDELKEYYNVDEERITIAGIPHFDLHLQEKTKEKHNSIKQPYVLFAMSAPRFAPNEIDIVEELAQKFSENFFGDTRFIIRPHPQNMKGEMGDEKWIYRLRNLEGLKNVIIQYPKVNESELLWSTQQIDMEEFTDTIANSKLLINSASTASLDAFAHKKNVILTSFDAGFQRDYYDSARRIKDYIHYSKIVSYDCLYIAENFNDLMQYIQDLLDDKTNKNINIEKVFLDQCYSYDGRSTQRVCTELTKIINE